MKQREIFIEALQREDSAERLAYLDAACGNDAELRQSVEELLSEHQNNDRFFLDASPPGLCVTATIPSPAESVGAQIGPYKIREQLAEGGMGVVYVAEQTKPVRRKVALKIIKPGMATNEVVARFEAERQALAMMDHPNIARVLDGGATDTDQPFFVMELVQGLPITEYCDEKKLSNRERLELFAKVCRAVQHAHRKGIIHRDLKPSNVLVAQIDGVAVPKVIDFGVAKAISQKLTQQTVYTQFSQMIGTPLYMSPEQAEMGIVDVDTRSDVYSLGVLLYELLTGVTPFDSETLKQAGFDEMRRIIREQEPSKPSARVSTLNAQVRSTIAEHRGSNPRKLSDSLRGELDWIVLKALGKDRNRRYESPSALAADVQRYLDGDVVEASPPSTLYRMKKSAARHKLELLAGAAVLAAMLAGTAIAVRQARKVIASQKQAEANMELAVQNAEESEALVNFILDGIIRAASPENARGTDPTIRQFLSQAESNVEQAFGDQPLLQAWVRHQIGNAYHKLGAYDIAEQNVSIALRIRRGLRGDEHPETLLSADTLALIWGLQGKSSEAIALAEETLDIRQRVRGRTHLKTLYSMNTLGRALLEADRSKEAEDVFQQLLDVSLEVDADEPALWASNNLAIVYTSQGNLDAAEKNLRRAIEVNTERRGKDYPGTLHAMHNLADLLTQAGRYTEAKALFQELLASRRQVQGRNHPDTLKALAASGNLYFRTGELSVARTQLEELLAIYRDRFGNHPNTAGVLNTVSLIDGNEDQLEESLSKAQEAFAIFDLHLGSDASATLMALDSVATAHKMLGNWDEAQRRYEDVIERRQQIRASQPDSYSNITSLGGAQCNLGALLAEQKKYEQAVQWYWEAIATLEGAVASSSLATARLFLGISHGNLSDALRRLGQHSDSLEELSKASSFVRSDERQISLEIAKNITIAASGQCEIAARQLEAILSEEALEPEHWYDAARLYAIAMAASITEGETPTEARQDQTERYANRAMQLLSKAVEGGYFRHPRKVALLETEEDFEAIREKEEFISMLQRLKEDSTKPNGTG